METSKKSRIIQYFLSYLGAGIFLLLMFLIFYYMSITTMESEVATSRFQTLEQARREMDYITLEMRNIADNFSGYLEEYTDLSSFSAVNEDSLCQRLLFYEESLPFSVEIMFFLRGDVRLYTSDGVLPYHVFEENYSEKGNLTMSSFYTYINNRRSNYSMRLSAGFFDKGEQVLQDETASVVYIFPLPYLDMLPRATIFFVLNSEVILEILEKYLGENIRGDIFLLNEMLNPLYSLNTLNLPDEYIKNLVSFKGVGSHEQHIGGRRYVLMRSVSEITGVSLVSVMHRGHFYARTGKIKIILFCSIVLLELMVIVYAIIMSRRNYGQIHRIEKSNLELQDTLSRQQPLVVYSCIRNLLSGDYGSIDEMEYYLQYAGVDISRPWFFVLIIVPAHEEKRSLGSQIRMIISAIEGEKIQSLCRFYALEIIPERYVAVIVNTAEQEVGGEDIRRFTSGILQRKINDNFNIQVKICSGQMFDSPSKIYVSFIEAQAVMSGQMLGKPSISLYEDTDGTEVYRYPMIEQSQYLQGVRQANAEAALDALDKMIDKAVDAEAAPVIQCLCYEIINTMMKAANQINSKISLKEIKNLTVFTGIEQFRETAQEFTVNICRQSAEKRDEKDSILKQEILEYIQENFRRVQFSLQEMADHFDLSVTYLSHFFKQKTGENFIDYLSFLRLETVKKELTDTDKQVKEIAYNVGYMDVASFIRKFKAQEGITPIQYRERMSATVKQTGKN